MDDPRLWAITDLNDAGFDPLTHPILTQALANLYASLIEGADI